MRTALGLCVIALMVSRCTLSPGTPPPAPRVQTDAGKAHVRACLQTHNTCTLPCYATDFGRNHCLQDCHAALADCYTTVE
jgi:hypothetical protein